MQIINADLAAKGVERYYASDPDRVDFDSLRLIESKLEKLKQWQAE